jgi:glycosyltransferase involved in cell wall biosynthesis
MYPAALMRISGFEIYFSILGTSTRIGLNGFITFFKHFRVKGLIFDLFCNTMKMLFFTFGQSQSPIPPSEIRISRRDGTKNYSGMVHLVQNPVQQSEVVRINASEFFKKVYPYLNNQKNQGVFVTNCFIAAGSTVFSLPRLKTKQTSDNLEYQRLYFYQDAIKMFKERPILGWGGGGWEEAYRAYQSYLYYSNQVHSHYFQIMVEAGLVGLVAILGIWFSFLLLTHRLYHGAKEDAGKRLLIWTITAASVAVGFHAAIDFNLSLSALAIVLWTLFGLARGIGGYPEPKADVKKNFDVFTLFSRWEGLPLTIIEAMLAGRPVVASAVGGVGELVAHGETGYLIEQGNLAEALEDLGKLAENKEMCLSMGDAGRRRALECFSLETMAGKYRELYLS